MRTMKLRLVRNGCHRNRSPLMLLLVIVFSTMWFSFFMEVHEFEGTLVASLATSFDTFRVVDTIANATITTISTISTISTSSKTTSSSAGAAATTTASEAPIRRWGCNRSETPTIFVHIGKAGGGQVRARLAAAALNYTRDNDWKYTQRDRHYYPLPDGETAKFCNSKNCNHRFKNSLWSNKSYEGNLPCNAMTPLGKALACPSAYNDSRNICLHCHPQGSTCHVVYVGHNHMGSEFHWLPSRYLQNWWFQEARKKLLTPLNQSQDSHSLPILDQGFKALYPNSSDHVWCPLKNIHRPMRNPDVVAHHQSCGIPLATIMDQAFRQHYGSSDYSPWYASLPLHRVVLLRDPWTWIVSKFFWHKSNRYYFDSSGQKQLIKCDDLNRVNYATSPKGGWASNYLLTYLSFLCGDDCESRLEAGLMTEEEAEIQAAGNLRNSFSVVGLLEETDTFLKMVSARISYIDTSLNPHITGDPHSSKRSNESFECDRLYKDADFRNRFRQAVPLMERIERLYQLGVKVNREQQQDLKECTGNNMLHHG